MKKADREAVCKNGQALGQKILEARMVASFAAAKAKSPKRAGKFFCLLTRGCVSSKTRVGRVMG